MIKPLLYYHTVRHLKPVQVWDRLQRRVKRPRVQIEGEVVLRDMQRPWIQGPAKPVSYLGEGRFQFLNQEGKVSGPLGWNDNQYPKLWLYHLHYFDWLGQPANQEEFDRIIEQWIEDNPVGTGNGWEPYPLSLRVVNWIKWAWQGHPLNVRARQSLAVQVDYLSQSLEYHLLGNHLFANAKALLMAGLFFEGCDAQQWLEIGCRLLREQIPEQILPDGGHFERSPMYHGVILEDCLDLLNALDVMEGAIVLNDLRSSLHKAVNRMRTWMRTLTQPDGEVCFFNDSTMGQCARWSELEIYAENWVGQLPTAEQVGAEHLRDSGFIRLSAGDLSLWADVGSVSPSYQPGHAHAGTLSCELSLGVQRILVNSGINTYEPGSERDYQRGSAAHNTVTVDGENSSELWLSHRVARRSRVEAVEVTSSPEGVGGQAVQTGFKRLAGVGEHRRAWMVTAQGLEVTDRIEGAGAHQVSVFWHLHPELDWVDSPEGVRVFKQGRLLGILSFEGDGVLNRIRTPYFPAFGVVKEKTTVQWRYDGHLPFQLVARFRMAEV